MKQILTKLIPILVLVGLAVLVLYYFKPSFVNKNTVQAKQFEGTVQAVFENYVEVTGVYTDETGKPIDVENNKPSIVKVFVNDQTNISRTLLILPTEAELEKTGGMFMPDELEKQESVGTLSGMNTDLKKSSIGIKTTSTKNIFSKKQFTASEINYRTVNR